MSPVFSSTRPPPMATAEARYFHSAPEKCSACWRAAQCTRMDTQSASPKQSRFIPYSKMTLLRVWLPGSRCRRAPRVRQRARDRPMRRRTEPCASRLGAVPPSLSPGRWRIAVRRLRCSTRIEQLPVTAQSLALRQASDIPSRLVACRSGHAARSCIHLKRGLVATTYRPGRVGRPPIRRLGGSRRDGLPQDMRPRLFVRTGSSSPRNSRCQYCNTSSALSSG
jgi:hypothetical protein